MSRAGLVRAETRLSDIARSIAEELKRKEPEREVTFAVRDNMVADADSRLIRVVLENLLGNAWKFTSKSVHARIEFDSESRSEGVVLFVRDNGAGFNMAYAEKLFRPFQRLHSEAEFPGTGIGLATVQRIVDRHGGRVWAEGTVGGGATVFFTLPAARSGGTR